MGNRMSYSVCLCDVYEGRYYEKYDFEAAIGMVILREQSL